jgi:denticleless
VLSHHSLKLDTFYPRLALSPCGNFLAAGSSTGNVLLWDTESVLRPGAAEAAKAPIILGGASAETSGVDWGHDSVSHFVYRRGS